MYIFPSQSRRQFISSFLTFPVLIDKQYLGSSLAFTVLLTKGKIIQKLGSSVSSPRK